MNMFTDNITDTPLPIVIEGRTFTANEKQRWNLNEIAKALGLPGTKAPSQWRTAIRRTLDQTANLHLAHGGASPGTWATEAGAIAYAMWVSTDFYLMVVRAFVVMRNDAVASARVASIALIEKDQILSDNLPKADALMRKAASYGVSWSEACHATKVDYPLLAKEYLRSIKRFQEVFDHDQGRYVLRPISTGFQKGYFKRSTGQFGNAVGWKVTDTGIAWLQEKTSQINQATAMEKTRKAKAKRAAKKPRGRPSESSRNFCEAISTNACA